MNLRENVYLRHQQQRFMRADAARYLCLDAARFLKPGSERADIYPALARKYRQDQERVPAGQFGAGRFADEDGVTDGNTQSEARPRVYITRTIGAGEDGSGDGGQNSGLGNDLDNFLLVAAGSPGIGHNSGSQPEEPPEIPQSLPPTREERMSFVRAAASWLFGRSAIAAGAFFGLLDQVEQLGSLSQMIRTANDPPSPLEELQRRAQTPSEPGYHDHHVVNQHGGNRSKFGDRRIDAPENVVRIPQLKHIEISRWYATKNSRFGGRTPQEALREMSWEEQTRIGLEQLRHFKVLE